MQTSFTYDSTPQHVHICALNASRYTGKERDAESGNDYFEARYYASSIGRWMSPDWSAKEEPVPYAKLNDPQSLNLYQYVGNNPLRFDDPDGHEAGYQYDPYSYGMRQQQDAAADFAEFLKSPVVHATLNFLSDLFNPTKNCPNCQIGIMPFGMTGGLSTLGAASRLSLAEISTGERLAAQAGLHLTESAHIGAEFVDSAGKTYDAMGQPAAYSHWNQNQFFNSIGDHLNKSVDYVAIDLKGASRDQISAIKTYVGGLAKEAQTRIKYVH
jgi:RHS repeat-associated protein